MPDEAIAEAKKALALAPSSDNLLHLNIVLVYAFAGRREDALALMNECLGSRNRKPIDTYAIAEIYAAVGDEDEAFLWLEQAYKDHCMSIAQLKIDPFIDSLRPGPRFNEYLIKVGLAK
jgi:tetratricopeptide (TPR) repeat protein